MAEAVKLPQYRTGPRPALSKKATQREFLEIEQTLADAFSLIERFLNQIESEAPPVSISGSGLDGRVAYWNGTNTLTYDDLYWDAANNRLGVNRSSPVSTLHVGGIGTFASDVNVFSAGKVRVGASVIGSEAFGTIYYSGGVFHIRNNEAAEADGNIEIGDLFTVVPGSAYASLNGDFVPVGDNEHDLGSAGASWRDLFLDRNAIIGGTLGVTGATTLSSLTSGRVVTTSTGGLLVADDIYWDAINNRLGIAKSSPASRLTIGAADDTNAGGLTLRGSDDVAEVAYLYGQNVAGVRHGVFDLADSAAGVRVKLDAVGDSYFLGGNVGIGDATPDFLLDVAGTFGADGASTFGSTVTISDDIILTEAVAKIRSNTADASDTKEVRICGGGDDGLGRGGKIILYGNENAGVGSVTIITGDASGANINLSVGSNPIMIASASGISFFTNSPSLGGGEEVIFIANATTNPTTNPTGGGIDYATGGAGTWRGSGGTVTTYGPS